ncbi:FAD:protein FMN transferase [Algisphaera agarilytica]|uniref:FAD:protein FMN transferase n=1 Tax=Algisphaera agarilytica TaxID=1385975 RepID=A0A7X0LLT1_9BACT|nr:FAD:protein FMN transferase [Algisphaera agarilytica]MBB6431342.1 thiamine biosynthesis lipoprotein [Algisphaera agarilytica]
MIDLQGKEGIHRFEHQAMNTLFSVLVDQADAAMASDAAIASFERLDRLEDALSRYREGSDISQINAMQSGESLLIQEDTHRCMIEAMRVAEVTGGLFDITLGSQIEHLKNAEAGMAPPVAGQLSLDDKRPVVHCIEAGRQLDLGGIGKGYALDRMAELVRDWGVESALLCSGASTFRVIGSEAWPIDLSGEKQSRRLMLVEGALSASGHAIQGAHLVRPDASGELFAGYRHLWLRAHDATWADALSTACMLMSPEQIREWRKGYAAADEIYFESPRGDIDTI